MRSGLCRASALTAGPVGERWAGFRGPFMLRTLALLVAGLALLAGLPARAAPSVESYGRLPAMANASLSPSGARYAYITVDHETRKLVVANVADNSAVFVSNVGT